MTLLAKKIKIPWGKPAFYGREKEYLADALDSTWISGGQYVSRFEKEFTSMNGARFGISVSNGTTALQLALLGLGIGPGDEVIVPGFTFVAPVNMVIAVGARPVYADIDPETWCIDPASVKQRITGRTKAIMPVHIYGNVCNMDAIKGLAKRYAIRIIEDTAEATLSRYRGRYAGTFGDIGCFSFQATKTITMGEGGFVITADKALHDKMRMIRDHGMNRHKRYWHEAVGYNFRLTNLQAAVGCGQLENSVKILADKRRVYGLYRGHLGGEAGISMQVFRPQVEPVVWAISVKIEPAFFKVGRDLIMKAMLEAGVETRPGFYTFGEMPVYDAPGLPVSKEVASKVISLPSFSSLKEEEIAFVCDTLKGLRK